jgi:hypothetical protein
VFNPPELAKAKDLKKLSGRLENDIVTATKRCAIDKVRLTFLLFAFPLFDFCIVPLYDFSTPLVFITLASL